ncbi:hypothetical protein HID58_087384 [Brassica napus]|uniref:LUC7 related protein n=1 Tax=Brassica napus TaxID=3708 RepID=A0ABQ7XVQ4_BRANA|nr:hypothetical protein HID58_087384 [Brassica napus]
MARDLTDEERRGFKEIKWDDREVCAFYMVRFCPHDLFVNTKSDLGACSRIHDPKLKESFENSPRHDSYVPKFEAELVQFCEKLVNDLDRKVRRGRERLAQEVEPPPPPTLSSEKAQQLSVLEEKIKNLLEQVEALGEDGKVDEAEALMRKVEALNVEKAVLLQRPNDKALAMVHEKKMALCEVCGSFLVANDAVDRAQSHVTGKQHVGYGMVRDFLAEQKTVKDKGKEEERLGRGKERNRGKARVGGAVLGKEKDTVIGIETDIETAVEIIESRMTGDPGVGERVVIEAGHVLLMEGLVTEGSREVPFASTSLRLSVVSISLGSGALQTDRGRIMKIVFLPVHTAILRV